MSVDAIQRVAALFARMMQANLAPPPDLSVTQWAQRFRSLSPKDSAEPGPYRVERVPYALEPQNALGSMNDGVKEVVLMWGAQTGKTTVANNWVGFLMDFRPGPLMVVQPTLDMAKRYSRQRLAPMIEECAVLKSKVAPSRSRDEANTTLLKEYPGGFLAVCGANSAAGLRSMPVRDIVFDETDAYPLDVDGEGDPISLAQARQTTFAQSKTLKTSTPTLRDFSRVEEAFLQSDQRYYMVECPHCGEHQALEWGAHLHWGLKWHKDAAGNALPDSAYYVCKHHGCMIEEHAKHKMTAYWQAYNEAADVSVRGYHLNSLYSPPGWLSWSQLVREWLAARAAQKKGDHSLMRAFVNTRLAQTWEDNQGDKLSQSELCERSVERPLGQVPDGVLMITQGVDVHPDRIERRVWGWGQHDRSWLIDVQVIMGDPNVDEAVAESPWQHLSRACATPLTHVGGALMPIEATAVDSGGHNTQAVYHWCRTHARLHPQWNVLAVKGSSQPNRAALSKPSLVDVNWRGKAQARGLKLWLVGTDTIKHLMFGRLRIAQPGAGFVDLPRELASTDEFEQLTVERLVTTYHKGHARLSWAKPNGRRNEALDCLVYAWAAAVFLGILRMRDVDWQRRRERVQPKTLDLFAAPLAASTAAVAAQTAVPHADSVQPGGQQRHHTVDKAARRLVSPAAPLRRRW